ncbi:SIS domain-containing protein [Streptomyces sp. TLI_171]|uniref:SIS domain-containing protein n=1 Tax=Streptomyces sp. TLI_171 TaxID=1938859 RepID=UPI0037DA5441
MGASGLVALDLQQKLHRIGRRVNAWVDPHIALTSAALLRGGDVAIGVSHTGDTAAHRRGPRGGAAQRSHHGGDHQTSRARRSPSTPTTC